MRIRRILPAIIICFFIISCNSDVPGGADAMDSETLYFDYKVWSEEGRENAVVKLQFRQGGPDGPTLLIKEPGKVELDGEELLADSTRFDGAYYEVVKPLNEFAGKHTIRFTSPGKKEYEEEFEFIVFTLDPDVPAEMQRGDLVFNFKGLDKTDYLRVWLSDTLFSSDDINDIDSVKNGRLVISRDRLSNIASGPINLQFHKEVDRQLKNTPEEGGRLYMTYALKREFILKD